MAFEKGLYAAKTHTTSSWSARISYSRFNRRGGRSQYNLGPNRQPL